MPVTALYLSLQDHTCCSKRILQYLVKFCKVTPGHFKVYFKKSALVLEAESNKLKSLFYTRLTPEGAHEFALCISDHWKGATRNNRCCLGKVLKQIRPPFPRRLGFSQKCVCVHMCTCKCVEVWVCFASVCVIVCEFVYMHVCFVSVYVSIFVLGVCISVCISICICV